MAYWQEHSLGVAPQTTGFGTPNTDDAATAWLLCDKPKVQLATEITELELLTGQIGAAPERLIGRRHGTLTFSIPLEGLKSGYNPVAEDPGDTGVIPPWLCLLANTLGSNMAVVDTYVKFWKGLHLSNGAYISAGMASGSSTTMVLDADPTTVEAGQLVTAAFGTDSTIPMFSFVKTLDTASKTLTLFDPVANAINSNDANIYGGATAWISPQHANQIPVTFRHVGENTEACHIYADAICTGWKLTWDSGVPSTLEMSYNFYDYSVDKTKGGLVVPDEFYRIPQIVGTNNGLVKLGKVVAGAATISTQCGLESCTLEYKAEITEIKCHSATQGIAAVVYRKPRITVGMSLAWQSTDEVRNAAGTAGNTGSHAWQSMLELGQTLSLGVYVGSTVGRIFAFHIPAARLVAVPQLTEIGPAQGYQLQLEAGAYSGDNTDHAVTASNSPLDAPFKIACS